jgi:hypothetical protein
LTSGNRRDRVATWIALLALAAALALRLGMHEGLVLSNGIKSRFWPWTPGMAGRALEAPALSDPVLQFVPWLAFARGELLAGRLPLWNPHQDGGVPLLGNGQSALGSPLAWPALALGIEKGWNLSLLLRALLAAAAAFLWLRDRGRSREAAALGAVAFAVSGPFVAWLEHPHTLAAAGVPLLLLFGGRLAERPARRDLAGLALATYLVLSGGHPETAILAAILAAAYALFRAGRPAGLLAPASGALLGAGLAAPLLFPFLEYFAASAARLGYARNPFVLPASALVRFVLPSDPASHPIEAAATVSLAVLALVPFGLAGIRRDRERIFWAAAAAALLFLAYGGAPARALAAATGAYVSRALLLLPLALGFLAAAGLDDLRDRASAAGRGRAARAAALGLVAAAAAELLVSAGGVHAVATDRVLTPETPLIARLRSDPDAWHVLPLHTYLPANTATDLALDDLRGYDALGPRAFRAAREEIGRFRNLPNAVDILEPWDLAQGGAALDAWSVKYLLLHPRFQFGAAELNAQFGLDLEEAAAGEDGRLLVNRRAMPRVRLEGAAGRARLVGRVPTQWRVAVDAAAPATLVVANATFPGWRATVDGAEARVVSPEGRPFAIPVPAGAHEVVLAYRPLSFRLGLACAALSVAGLLFGRRLLPP